MLSFMGVSVVRRTTSVRWVSTLPRAATAQATRAAASHDYLHLVSQTIQKVAADKTAGASSTLDISRSAKAIQAKQAWQFFEKTLHNAKSCVNDLAEAEANAHWQDEISTAEQALSEVQAAYVDLLDVLRLGADLETSSSSVISREEGATTIRNLRRQLDRFQEQHNKEEAGSVAV